MTHSTDIRQMFIGEGCEQMARAFHEIVRWQQYGIIGTVTVNRAAARFSDPDHVNPITLPRLSCLDGGDKSA